MKNFLVLLLLLMCCFGCEKGSIGDPGDMWLLQEISVDGKIYESFEYDGMLLTKESYYGHCKDNPVSEYTYFYKDDRLNKLNTVTRAFYSDLNMMCNPESGYRSDAHFQYNNEGKLSKVTMDSTYIEFQHTPQGFVRQSVLYRHDGQKVAEIYYRYDPKGNLIEVSDADGAVQYKYDDKINPFYLMNQRPGWISPFNKSPNNVIKAMGATEFEREFEYNARGLPVQLRESNGLTYLYNYQ